MYAVHQRRDSMRHAPRAREYQDIEGKSQKGAVRSYHIGNWKAITDGAIHLSRHTKRDSRPPKRSWNRRPWSWRRHVYTSKSLRISFETFNSNSKHSEQRWASTACWRCRTMNQRSFQLAFLLLKVRTTTPIRCRRLHVFRQISTFITHTSRQMSGLRNRLVVELICGKHLAIRVLWPPIHQRLRPEHLTPLERSLRT